jgi:geranylgeranyl diphosphate synthase, type II
MVLESKDSFLEAYLQDRRKIVEESLHWYLPTDNNRPVEIYKAVHYSVFAGGKRIRPILCLAAVEACGGNFALAMPVACALELIHTYSLIHDDLPSMDNDDFRRGKPTSHKVFGESIAILAGDALLTEAFVLLSREGEIKFSAEKRLAVIQEIAQAAGIAGMVGGQAQDVLAEKSRPDQEILQDIHRRKTAALIKAAVKSGAIMSNARENRIKALADYGLNIGMAFQIADDILNVEGDRKLMGKETGSDTALGKVTYPSLMGMDYSKTELQRHIDTAIDSISVFDQRALPLRLIACYIMERKS